MQYIYCSTCSGVLPSVLKFSIIRLIFFSGFLDSGSTGLVIGSLSPFGSGENKENWNFNLYHGGSTITEAEKLEGRRICFECLLRQILSLKSASSSIGGAIIAPGDEVKDQFIP